MDDVVFGFVDFSADEEWTAVRGDAFWRLAGPGRGDRVLEATRAALVLDRLSSRRSRTVSG
jgi:hypothetical protein